jgi:hypothetical protein
MSLLTKDLLTKLLNRWKKHNQDYYMCHELARVVKGPDYDMEGFKEIPEVAEFSALLFAQEKTSYDGGCWHTTHAKKLAWLEELVASMPDTKPRRDYVADHARRTLRRLGMTAEQAKKFVERMPAEKRSGLSRTLPERWYYLQDSFRFSSSPEGFDYWNDVRVLVEANRQRAVGAA